MVSLLWCLYFRASRSWRSKSWRRATCTRSVRRCWSSRTAEPCHAPMQNMQRCATGRPLSLQVSLRALCRHRLGWPLRVHASGCTCAATLTAALSTQTLHRRGRRWLASSLRCFSPALKFASTASRSCLLSGVRFLLSHFVLRLSRAPCELLPVSARGPMLTRFGLRYPR